MNREHLIIAGGSLVIGLLVLANVQQVRENTSTVVHTQTEIGQILPQSETVLATPKPVTAPASKISPSAVNQTFETREEIQRQVALIEADFKRSTSQTARSAGTLFRGMDMDQYLRDLPIPATFRVTQAEARRPTCRKRTKFQKRSCAGFNQIRRQPRSGRFPRICSQ